MTDDRKTVTESESNKTSVVSFFGPPPLVDGEDTEAYNDLLMQVSSAVHPADTVEEILVRDVVDYTWEILRWRRAKISLVKFTMQSDLKLLLSPLFRRRSKNQVLPRQLVKLVELWAVGDKFAANELVKRIASANLTTKAVIDRNFLKNIEQIERLEQLITTYESRRNAALREIDRHRAALAQALREKVQDIEDAEFETIEPTNESSDEKAA